MEPTLYKKLSDSDKSTIDNIGTKLSRILAFTPTRARFFNDHGAGHSMRIISNMNNMLSKVPAVFEKITPKESFILLASAWLHDVGYTVNEKDEKKLSDEEIQKNHNELSYYFIKNHYHEIGLEDDVTAELIGKVCFSHRRSVIIEDIFRNKKKGFKGDTIRPRFLVGLLSLSDALDTDVRRAPELYSGYVNSLPEESRRHWLVCQYISGIRFDPDNSTIFIDAKFENESEKRDIIWKLKHLNEELDRVLYILVENHLPYTKIICCLEGKGEMEEIDIRKYIKEEKEIKGIEFLDMEVEYWIRADREGNARITRRNHFVNTSNTILEKREHLAHSTDVPTVWDWEKDVKAWVEIDDKKEKLNIEPVSDRPTYKKFNVFFHKKISPGEDYEYFHEFFWPKTFPQKHEFFTGYDNSLDVIFNLFLPGEYKLKKIYCIERFSDGRTKKLDKIKKKRKLFKDKNLLMYRIKIKKENRDSLMELHWMVR